MSNNLFRKSSNTSKPQNLYEAIGFKRNPFPVDACIKFNSVDELENGSIYLPELRTSEQEQFESLLISNNDKKIVLLMDYAAFRGRGIGKTAFLNHGLRRINEDLGFTISMGNSVLYAIYIKPGGEKKERKFYQISKLIFEAMVEQKLLLIAFARLRAFSGLINDEILTEVGDDIAKTITNDDWLKSKRVDVVGLDLKLRQDLRQEGISDELINSLRHLGVSPHYFQTYFVEKKTEIFWRNNESKFLYNDLVKLFKLAGFTNIVILFDECEKIITAQNFQERRSFCDNLRYYFIDGTSENVRTPFFKLLLTIHPLSQELLNPHWSAAGLERFVGLGGDTARHYTVFFNPLNVNSAIPLAKAYLQASRIDMSKTDSIEPFDEEALKSALEKSEGIPGKFLQLLNLAVEMSVKSEWSTISTSEIEKVVKAEMSIKKESNSDSHTPYQDSDINLND